MSRLLQVLRSHHANSAFNWRLVASVFRSDRFVVSWIWPIGLVVVAGCLTVPQNDRSVSLLPADQRFGGFDGAVVTARPAPAAATGSVNAAAPGFSAPGSNANTTVEQSTTTVDSRIGRGAAALPGQDTAATPSGTKPGAVQSEQSTEALRANPPLGRRLPRKEVPIKPRGTGPSNSANDSPAAESAGPSIAPGDDAPAGSPSAANVPAGKAPPGNAPAGNGTGSEERVAELTPPRVELDDIDVAAPLVLQVDAPTSSQVNGFTTYQLTIRNVDDTAVSDVVVRCEFEAGLTCPGKSGQWVERRIAAMPVGDVQTFPLTLQSDRVGRLCCGFRVSGVSGSQPFELPAVERCVEFQPRKIEVAITGPEQRTVGSQAEYTLLIRNLTDSKFDNLLVRLNHDVAISVRDAPGANSQSTTGVEWKLPALQPRQELMLPVEFDCLSPANRACFTADVSGDSLAHETVEACLQIVPVPGLLDVQVRDASDPLEVGRKGRYEITVRNIGLQTVQSIALNVSLTSEVNITSTGVDLGKQLLPLECTVSPDARTADFEMVETLQPDQQLVYVITVQGIRKGTAELTAKVTSSLSKTPVQVVEPTNVVDPNDDQARF